MLRFPEGLWRGERLNISGVQIAHWLQKETKRGQWGIFHICAIVVHTFRGFHLKKECPLFNDQGLFEPSNSRRTPRVRAASTAACRTQTGPASHAAPTSAWTAQVGAPRKPPRPRPHGWPIFGSGSRGGGMVVGGGMGC